MTAIRARVVSAVAEHFGRTAAGIADTATFLADLGGDELDRIEIIMALEHEFEIYATDDEIERFVTVGDLAAWLEHKAREKA